MSNAMKRGTDGINWFPVAKVIKYNPDTTMDIARFLGKRPEDILGGDLRRLEAEHGLIPDAITVAEGNLLVTVGLDNLTKRIIGTGQAFDNTHALVGVGASSPTAAVGDTALAANGGSAYYQGADASNPTQANGVITCNSTFATGNGNFAWNEWCWATCTGAITPGATLASVATGTIMMNHKVQSLGTKVSGATWTLQATVTLS